MDHVIAPLDADHVRVVAQLVRHLAATLGIQPEGAGPRRPHITVASYRGLEPTLARGVLAPVVAKVPAFTVRAHGYGIFAGDADTDLSLHVMVVRSRALDQLHCDVHNALREAGACLAGTTDPSAWTPHITLLDHGLSPRLLGDAVEILTRRPHRTWSIPVVSLAIARRGSRMDARIGALPVGGPVGTSPAR